MNEHLKFPARLVAAGRMLSMYTYGESPLAPFAPAQFLVCHILLFSFWGNGARYLGGID